MISPLEMDPSQLMPPLPSAITTHDGVVFDPRQDDWRVGSLAQKARIRFDIFDRLSRRMVHCLKWGLIFALQNTSCSHAGNLYFRFKAFYRSVLEVTDTIHDEIELSHILSYRGRLSASTEWYLGVIRILLNDMDDLGFGIASEQAVEYLSTSTIRGNIKGTSVRTRDSEKGSFTDTELLAIQSALNDAYARRDIDLTAFAITWLFLAYGPRPVQIAALKEKDLLVSENDEGPLYACWFPRGTEPVRRIISIEN